MIEMAWRLARRGHDVKCYCPLADDADREWRGTVWRDVSEADLSEKALWIFVRSPGPIVALEGDQPAWLVCQDVDYFDLDTVGLAERVNKVMALCSTHKRYIERYHPALVGKVEVSSNGIKSDLMSGLAVVSSAEAPVRNPKRLMYASSPDRGLLNLLKIFPRAREIVPDLELHCFYGRENMIAASKMDGPHAVRAKSILAELDKHLDQPNVFWGGRVGQERLWQEWLKTGLWVHPSTFTETSCITSMEAQALGAIPITNPLWAVGENVRHGTFLRGDPEFSPLIRARYAGEIVRYSMTPGLQERIRPGMMAWALKKFDWDVVVDQWENWMSEVA